MTRDRFVLLCCLRVCSGLRVAGRRGRAVRVARAVRDGVAWAAYTGALGESWLQKVTLYPLTAGPWSPLLLLECALHALDDARLGCVRDMSLLAVAVCGCAAARC